MQGSWRQKYLRYKSYLLNTVDRYEERTDVRVYLEILLSLVTISIFSLFALRPTILTIAELIKEIEAKEVLVNKLDDKIQTITSAQILYDRQRDNIQVLKESIPSSPEGDTLIYQLEGLVGKNNVKVITVTVGQLSIIENTNTNNKKDKKDKNGAINFNIRLSGDYVSLFGFIKDMESLVKPIKIVNTSIAPVENEKTKEKSLNLSLIGRIPFTKSDQSNKK